MNVNMCLVPTFPTVFVTTTNTISCDRVQFTSKQQSECTHLSCYPMNLEVFKMQYV